MYAGAYLAKKQQDDESVQWRNLIEPVQKYDAKKTFRKYTYFYQDFWFWLFFFFINKQKTKNTKNANLLRVTET